MRQPADQNGKRKGTPMAEVAHTHQTLPESDLLIGVTVQVGEHLYRRLKDASPGDAAHMLRGCADRSTGAVRAMFLLLAEWQGLVPLAPIRELPDPNKAGATGGTLNVQAGLCGTNGCSENQMPIYANNVFQYCAACAIIS
jgi:hypothetical protein